MRICLSTCLTGLLLALCAGCGGKPGTPEPAAIKEKPVAAPPVVQPVEPQAAEDSQPAAALSTKPPPRPPRAVGPADDNAVKKVATAIKDSVEIGPTLVVWIIDRTPSARNIVRDISAAAQNFYDSPEASEWLAAEEKPLLSSIVSFDSEAQFVLDPPTSDQQRVQNAFEALKPSTSGREMTFTAIQKALERYLSMRTSERRELLFVVVTDEAGDDPAVCDELLETTRRNAIPVYVIGLPAPWGQVNPLAKNPKTVANSNDDSTPTVGPESVLSERVDIAAVRTPKATGPSIDLVDSGFGPFALERLCRASRGQFIALRNPRDANAKTWPSGSELKFDESVASKYAPDYLSQADYQKLVAENKARAALIEAAKMSMVEIEGTPGSRFPKETEAKMAKTLSQAQQFAARNLPAVDQLCEMLLRGESDRPNLTAPRWQAQFDLALGRALAQKARLDGYNSMIAILKRGKPFQNADSKAWLLEPADQFDTESTIRRTADKAKMYLERVIHEHPGTPWAKIAEEELKKPLGWTWKES